MVNNIIETIGISLAAEFHEKEYEIYMEEKEQDFKKPCFFITCLGSMSRRFLGKRYFMTNQFVIQYFPSTVNPQRECNEAAQRMMYCLEYITMPGEDKPIRGTDMKYEIINGILKFFVNYDCFVSQLEQLDVMETMDVKTSMKEGD